MQPAVQVGGQEVPPNVVVEPPQLSRRVEAGGEESR